MKWGLVLSGGLAHGLANVGVIQVLEEAGLRPDAVAGSSMGAIVGGLYALGVPTSSICELAKRLRPWNVAKVRPLHQLKEWKSGLLQQQIREHLDDLIDGARIGDTRIPFVCVAGEIRAQIDWKNALKPGFAHTLQSAVHTHVFPKKTHLTDALMASSAIPLVFAPVSIDGRTYMDLGSFRAIPSRELRRKQEVDLVIGTDTVPRYGHIGRLFPRYLSELVHAAEREIREGREACDLVIEPRPAAGYLRFDRAPAFIAAGRKAAEGALLKIRVLLRE